MELKILCPCGAKYKFDVEPVNGQLPASVQCPACGADGTQAGNEALAQMLAAAPPAAVSAVAPATSFAKPAMKIAAPAASAAPALSVAAHTPAEPPPSATPTVPVAGLAAAPAKTKSSEGEYSITRGIVGAAIGGLIGMLVWYGFIVVTNIEFGLIAWGLGAFTGFCATFMARGNDNPLGVAAGLIACMAILGGQYLATRHIAAKFINKGLSENYGIQVAYAKEVVAAKTDDELKAIIAKNESDDGVTLQPSDVDADRLAEFKRSELPELRDLASGKTTQAQFEKDQRAFINAFLTPGLILKETFTLWTLLWLFLGVGSAYRIASGG